MVKKTSSGDYKCEHCGKIISTSKKARSHEALCGMDNLGNYMDNVENATALEIPENEVNESKQVQYNSLRICKTRGCNNTITTEDLFREREDSADVFECSECGNLQSIQR